MSSLPIVSSRTNVRPAATSIAMKAWEQMEDARIRRHLRIAHAEVSQHTPAGLSDDQRTRRAAALDFLARFIDKGEFPRNASFKNPIPFIRDENGRVCAFAAMALSSGDAALVEHLETVDNNMWLADVSDDRLGSWLRANGLTQQEAARIQPAYQKSFDPTFWVFGATFITVLFATQWVWYTLAPAKKFGRLYAIGVSTFALAAAVAVSYGTAVAVATLTIR